MGSGWSILCGDSQSAGDSQLDIREMGSSGSERSIDAASGNG